MASNPFEWAGRAEKVARLMAQVRRELKGLDADSGAQLVADFLRAQDDEWWLEFARRAGVSSAIKHRKVPSRDTREAVALAFEALVDDDPNRSDPTPEELAEVASW